MYNTGELANFDPSMLQYTREFHFSWGMVGFGLQIAIILLFFGMCIYHSLKGKNFNIKTRQ